MKSGFCKEGIDEVEADIFHLKRLFIVRILKSEIVNVVLIIMQSLKQTGSEP